LVTFEEARALVQAEIDGMSGGDLELMLLDAPTMTEPYGWVFFYDDRRHFETGDFKYASSGNAPFLVLGSRSLRPSPGRSFPASLSAIVAGLATARQV
jgi:hypothetical protein